MSKVIVIGGGAAGMMAAIGASRAGNQAVLFEKNEKLGKKLYITGKGRCNLTNNSDVESLLKNVMQNPRFLYSAFYTLDSSAVMDFFESEGLSLKTERGNRVFPCSDKASDVIRTLQEALEASGVELCLNTVVDKIKCENGRCSGVILKGGQVIHADAVIVATGGISYPSTGSTGDGYRFAEAAGHQVVQAVPSLVPFCVKEDYIKELQGLSLRNVVLRLVQGKKKLFEEMGELLFTHFGISGPLVLSASSVASGKYLGAKGQPIPGTNPPALQAYIDLKPALSVQQLDERVLRDFQEFSNSYFKNSLQKLFPAKLIPVIVRLSKIEPEKKVNEITKKERQELVNLTKAFPFTIDGLRGYNEAVVTRGGVSVKEINPATMESKKREGLYFAGEVLDVDARTGGYNLQIAWSTGYLAGISAAS